MKSWINPTLLMALVTVFSMQAKAETREAWVSAISYDGKSVEYKYTAFDTKGPVEEDAKVVCTYTAYGNALAVRSVELKLFITADFSQTGSQTERAGRIDLSEAIKRCQAKLPASNARPQTYPVEVKLPAISTPVSEKR